MSTAPLKTIPAMTDPLSKYWEQPDSSRILIDESVALMTQKDFDALHNYSHSIPTGTYIGKMWKAKGGDGKWYLCWYDHHHNPGYLAIPAREIVLCQ